MHRRPENGPRWRKKDKRPRQSRKELRGHGAAEMRGTEKPVEADDLGRVGSGPVRPKYKELTEAGEEQQPTKARMSRKVRRRIRERAILIPDTSGMGSRSGLARQ